MKSTKSLPAFGPANEWSPTAHVGFRPDDWDAYAWGYRDAADVLVEQCLADAALSPDVMVYPIAFLYRHFLEARLKELTRRGGLLVDRQAEVPTHHSLSQLWTQVRSYVVEVWADDDEEYLSQVDSLIQEFDDVDRGSFAFRYPVTRDGKPSLPRLSHVNLRQLRNAVAPVADLLDGISSAFDEYLQNKYEMEAEYAEEMYEGAY